MGKYILIIEDEKRSFGKLEKWVRSMSYSVLPENKDAINEMIKAVKDEIINDFVMNQIKSHYKEIKLILCDIFLGSDYEAGNKIAEEIREYKKSCFSEWFDEVPIIGISDKVNVASFIKAGGDWAFPKSDIEERMSPEEQVARYMVQSLIKRFENKLSRMKIDNKKVFIVHGRAKKEEEIAAFLKDKLRLEPIILREQAGNNRTIIEKIDKYSDVGFAVVLYTACDEGRLRSDENNEELKPRARQNVVFEHGYMISKLGRDRVCTLVEPGVEISTREKIEMPGDTSGVEYVLFDKEGTWMQKLTDNMKSQGIEIILNNQQ